MSTTLIQSLLTGVLQGLIYALIGFGLYLVFTVMGVVNFAHGHIVLLGMYGMLMLDPKGLAGYALGLLIVAVVAAVFGYVVQWALIEAGLANPGHSQLVITLSLGLILQYTFQIHFPVPFQTIDYPYPWAESIRFSGITISSARVTAGVVSLAIGAVVSFLVYRTRAGNVVRACSDNLRGAIHAGVNVPRTFRFTFALGAALAAIAGGLMLPIEPVSPTLGLEFAIKAFIVVVIGGIGSLWGSLAAGIILGLAEALGSVYAPGSLSTAVVYALFFLIILARPEGITRKVFAT
jgi:branched-chain amino acid transport system permease protein